MDKINIKFHMPLSKLAIYFYQMYEKRDTLILRDHMKRLGALAVAIGGLQDAIRKNNSKNEIAICLARIVSRIFRLTSVFGRLNLTEIMARKYPSEFCSYCQHYPCDCPEQRQPSKEKNIPSTAQIGWPLGDWCDYLNRLYGQRNRQKGIENILNRLFKEVTELMIIELSIPAALPIGTTIQSIEEEYTRELADTLAWTIAVANYFEIDLEFAVVERYKNGCPRCHESVCMCIHSSFGDNLAQTIG